MHENWYTVSLSSAIEQQINQLLSMHTADAAKEPGSAPNSQPQPHYGT